MGGYDLKYGDITNTKGGAISPNEPVFLFRAKDRLLPAVLSHYRLLCEQNGSPEHHLHGIDAAAEAVEDWQREHYTQTPGTMKQ